MAEMVIIPAIVMGVLVGIIDMFFMIKDEGAMAAGTVLSKSLRAFIPIIIFSIVAFNLEFVGAMDFIKGTFFANLNALRAGLVVLLAIIIHARSAAYGRGAGAGLGLKGSHERWLHVFIVAGLVVAGPYIWPMIENYFSWVPGV
tara:strand:- start:4183 stop:4614 length:432 start_codon:yes stop_codon:yes gene_type:complete